MHEYPEVDEPGDSMCEDVLCKKYDPLSSDMLKQELNDLECMTIATRSTADTEALHHLFDAEFSKPSAPLECINKNTQVWVDTFE